MHCEDLWRDFREHADSHFVSEFCRHFHQRWFEMYLAVSLLRRGFDVRSQDTGPDILLETDGGRICIEAVCATAGEIGHTDSVPKAPLGKAFTVPVRQYVLRIRSALEDKARKFNRYLEEKIVCEDDNLAIAINIYGIDGIIAGMDDVVMRALYGRGDLVLTIDKYTREPKNVSRQPITKVFKKSGSAVGTIPFVDFSLAHISSALVFWGNAANRPGRLGDDCVLYPNLSCRNSWQQGTIAMGREWRFTPGEDGWEGSPIDHLDH